RQHDLHSQIWSDPPCRTRGPQALPQPDHVPGAHVLGSRRDLRRGWNAGQRWHHWLAFCLAALLVGCEVGFEPGTVYSDARKKLTQGFFDSALEEADEGYHQTEQHDLLWSWKFRVLKAEVHLRQGNPRAALELLSPELPGSLPEDLSVRKKIAQGEAL